MLEQIRSVVVWLATIDPALPRALLVALVFAAVYLIRKLFPRTWEFFARAVPVPVIDPAPLLLVLSKAWQALPGALLGAVASALATGGDVRAAVKGAVFGALAAVAHEFAKAAPWLPYTGAIGRMRAPALPVLVLFVPAVIVSTWPSVTGCASLGRPADTAPVADHPGDIVALLGKEPAAPCLGFPEEQCSYADRFVPICGAFAIVHFEQTMLATAAHCVPENATTAAVLRFYAPSGWGHGLAGLVERDDAADVAFLGVTEPDLLEPLRSGPMPLIGETVHSYSPVLRASSSGKVSAWLGSYWFETTQTAAAGWSGSPVLDVHGAVVGLISRCPSPIEGAVRHCSPGRVIVATRGIQ